MEGTCQIPDPVYKFVGSIVCFYIPLGVMLLTYTLTVQLLAHQQQNLGGGKPSGWLSGWMGIAPPLGELRRKSMRAVVNLHFHPIQNGRTHGSVSSRPVCRRHRATHTLRAQRTPSCQRSTLILTSCGCPSRGTRVTQSLPPLNDKILCRSQHSRADAVNDDSAPSIRSRNAEALAGLGVVRARQRVSG